MTDPSPHPTLFCPTCLSYLGPVAAVCLCGWERPAAPAPPGKDRPLWRAKLDGPARGRPLVVGDLLLCAWGQRRGPGGVNALDLRSGERRWAAQTAQSVQCEPAEAEGRVFFASLSQMGLGEGAQVVCCDLEDGRVIWEKPLSGGAWSPPLVMEARLYIACDDGKLHCLDTRTGKPIPGWPLQFERGRLWLLPHQPNPLLLDENGKLTFLRVEFGRSEVCQSHDLGMRPSSPPLDAGDWLLFGSESGQLAGWDLSGSQAHYFEGQLKRIPAQPAFDQGRVYLGGHDRQLHCWDISSRKECWSARTERSISSSPVLGEGLVAVADNGGKVYAFEALSGELAWDYTLTGAAPVFSSLGFDRGVVYIGDESGQVTALPWHLGHSYWAGKRLSAQGRYAQAGEYFALAADLECFGEDQKDCAGQAAHCWEKAGEYEKAAAFCQAQHADRQAADDWRRAGQRFLKRDPDRAIAALKKAAGLYFRLRLPDELNQVNRMLAISAHLPFIKLEDFNVPDFIQWEAGQFWLRMYNDGQVEAPSPLRFWLGGGLQSAVEAKIAEPFMQGACWTIPLNLTATQEMSELRVEIEYDTGHSYVPILHGMLAIPIRAVPPTHKPLQIGNVGMLKVSISGETLEGLKIETRNVGALRSEAGIDDLHIQGDAGSVSARGEVGNIQVDGDVGLLKN